MLSTVNQSRLEELSRERLIQLSKRLLKRCQRAELRMLTKQEVAGRLGMTVSWLDNSQSQFAGQIRATGVRYGSSRTSPVRYPLIELIQIMESL